MNAVDARAVAVFGGYEGHFRKVHRAAWEAVRVNGIVQLYATAEAAEVAAWRALRAHLCSDIVGDGEKAVAAKIEAGRLFLGGGRVVTVERR